MGRRPSYYIKYTAGFDDAGKLNGIEYEWYNDPGVSPNGSYFFLTYFTFESAYKCANYEIKLHQVKTNKAACVEIRSPDFFQSICITESVLDHVAGYLHKDPLEVRQINLISKMDETVMGHKLTHVDIENVTNELKASAEYLKRKAEIDSFNRQNRYKKKGISLIPIKYPIFDVWAHYNAIVSVRHHDGSVAISHGGVEMG
jgi:xanthine dehydrogenase molybdopterin-binding subunit B